MTTTGTVDTRALIRYGCVLCGQHFQLSSGQAALPAHRYPTGLFRGRPCASAYGVRV